MNRGEVWFVEFPVEEIAGKTTNRPVVVLDEYLLEVLSVKITKHKPRKDDPYDIPILYSCSSFNPDQLFFFRL